MPLQLIRVVKRPDEGLYAFRFELRAGNNRPITLTTDFNGNGLYRVLPRKAKDTGPSDAWRAICFAAGKPDLIETVPENAIEILPPTANRLCPTLCPQEAASYLLGLELERLDKIEPREDTVYLDETRLPAYKKALVHGG